MENRMMFIAALVALAIVALQSTLFTVKEYERAVLFQFGEF
ncbi:MAG TPA: protease modulator HflC, partial [Gammaproteobacteria bacterium]|nr:protease modulator HflC [Gammaproteobacteria bacterium]